jgi:tRNA-dihydrouridine synthase
MSNFWTTLRKPIKALAPMEDVTDTVFRRIVGSCGRPDVFFTEFTNTDGMCSEGRDAVIHRLQFTEGERPIVAQIWGNNPDHYLRAARDLREMGFDGIDINMGCPVRKIVKNGSCSGLIENRPLAQELVLAAKEGAGDLPVSVKTRLGFRRIETEEWASFLLSLKPAVLTMHGRIAKELSEFPAKWDEIGKVVRLRNGLGSSTLILGNGDVMSLREIDEKVSAYGVDGVMVGRGIFQNIFLFNPDRADADVEPAERIELLKEHMMLYRHTWGSDKNFEIMKKFVKVYISSFTGAAKLRGLLMDASGYEEIDEILATWPTAAA